MRPWVEATLVVALPASPAFAILLAKELSDAFPVAAPYVGWGLFFSAAAFALIKTIKRQKEVSTGEYYGERPR